MNEDVVEFVCGLSLLAIVAFALTPAFWQLIVFLGR
jgi:hypothetical protein